MLCIGIETSFCDRNRGWAFGVDLSTPLVDLLIQLIIRIDRVDQPHVQRFFRGIPAAEVPHLARLFLADHVSQKRRPETGIDGANFRSDLAKDRIVGRDRQVAQRAHNVTAADGKSANLRDDGFRHFAEAGVDFLDRNTDYSPAVAFGFPVPDLIAARAKRFAACPGQYD